jgi:hypothetical protein
MDTVSPEQLVTRSAEALGGAAEPRADGCVDLLVPAPLQPLFGGRELVTLGFDPLVTEHVPEAELAVVGSPVLDELTNALLQRGTTAQAVVPVPRLRQGGLEERVGEVVAFLKCRLGSGSLPQDGALCGYAQFDLKLTLTSDERREKLYSVLVDLRTNRPCPELAERLPELRLSHEPPPRLARKRLTVAPDRAYQTACAHVRTLAKQEIDNYQARIERRLEVELSRIADYYDESAEQLRKRKEQAAARGDAPGAFDERIEATVREQERKLRETADNCRLRCQARLLSARLLYQPKISFSINVERKRFQRDLELFYDPVLNRMEPVLCEVCTGVARELSLTDDLRFACGPCFTAGK